MSRRAKIEPMGASKTVGRYQLGDCIGKGGFGSVYKALDMATGGLVAVKQILVENLPESELTSLMNEIDLMKKLNSEYIVQYIGFEKTKEHLNIIMEFCENGSLQSISKKFGKFPETLMSLYTSQVLEGLIYLHGQGVIHRDIKGANILTTKDGRVKLADFGVATSATDVDDNQVVGTPYWMAPEVIELSGVSTASDIWSVGCTIIELMAGEPPYSDLGPLPAMFRIVQDDHPPLPDGVSEALEDLLLLCFQRDPKLRSSATKLKKHKWVQQALKTSQAGFSDAVKTVQEWNEALDSNKNSKPRTVSTLERNSMIFDSLQIASVKFLKGEAQKQQAQQQAQEPGAKEEKGRAAEAGAKPATAPATAAAAPAGKPSPQAPLLLMRKPSASSPMPSMSTTSTQVQKRFMEKSEEENWDDDFDLTGDLVIPSGSDKGVPDKRGPPSAKLQRKASSIDDPGTVKVVVKKPAPPGERPPLAQSPTSPTPTATPTTASTQASSRYNSNSYYSATSTVQSAMGVNVEDLEDWIEFSEDTPKFNLKPKLSPEKPKLSLDAFKEDPEEDFSEDLDLSDSDSPKLLRKPSFQASPAPGDQSIDRKTSLKRLPQTPLQEYSEDNNAVDYSEDFLTNRTAQESPVVPLDLRKAKSAFWSGSIEEEDEDDIFDDQDDFEHDKEQTLIKEKRAKAVADAQKLFSQIRATTTEHESAETVDRKIISICDELSPLLRAISEPMSSTGSGKRDLISQLGVTPLIEIVELFNNELSNDVIISLLHLVSEIMFEDSSVLECLMSLGAIPVLMRYAAPKYDLAVRSQAALFISTLCHAGEKALQTILSSRSLGYVVDLLDEEYEMCSALVWTGISCIREIFSLERIFSKTTGRKTTELSRLLMNHSAAAKLAVCFHNISGDKRKEAAGFLDIISEIFEKFVLSDGVVRAHIARRETLKYIVRELENLHPAQLLKMLKNIKALSGDVNTLEGIQKSGAIPVFIRFLEYRSEKFYTEICSAVMVIMYNFCKICKPRQEFAAAHGLVPHLVRLSTGHKGLKQLAMEILCDLAHGEKCRPYLKAHNVLQYYLSFLTIPTSYINTNALESIAVWMLDKKEKVVEAEKNVEVERVLAQRASADKIVHLFAVATDGSMLDPLMKIVTNSEAVSATLAENTAFVTLTLERLSHRDALIKLNLLKILKPVLQTNKLSKELLRQRVLPVMQTLEGDKGAVMVREMALKLRDLTTTLIGDA